jgi:hypothetical protein
LIFSLPGWGQSDKSGLPPPDVMGAHIVQVAGEPELRVDGVPFFIHAAQFDYFRIPRDLWAQSLDRYRELGINTIDLRIPWNWHELSAGEFDFNGHTNPRRDLHGLLELIARRRLRLIVRPGPVIGDQWRDGGLPDWLPGEAKASADTAAIARPISGNRPDERAVRRWFNAVAHEIAPYSSRHVVRLQREGPKGEAEVRKVSGPLLFVALDDGVANRGGAVSQSQYNQAENASHLSSYLGNLQTAVTRGGLDPIFFATASDLAASGAALLTSTPAPGARTAIGLASQWTWDPFVDPVGTKSPASGDVETSAEAFLAKSDAASLAFQALSLGTQSSFPPFLSGFSTTAFVPAEDVEVAQPAAQNLLLGSRLWIGDGIRGIEYAPLQDSLTPAGWSAPAASRYYRWDAPLDLIGNRGPRASGVARNGLLTSAWGAMLAASHLRADFGIVDLRTAFAAAAENESAASRFSAPMETVFRTAQAAGFLPELVNPGAQSIERLRRDTVLLLPVPSAGDNFPGLSETAQRTLVEFVGRGGTLVYFPSRPPGALLDPLWHSAPPSNGAAAGVAEWSFGQGHVISSTGDFLSPATAQDSIAVPALAELLDRAGVQRFLPQSTVDESAGNLIVTALVPNEYATSPNAPAVCGETQMCAAELISVTNLGDGPQTLQSFSAEDPRPTSVGRPPGKIPIDVSVPAHDSMLLPLHAPLCSAASGKEHCADEVISAGAELLQAERDDKDLELTFYAPTRAIVRLHLESAPTRVEIDPDMRLETKWTQESGVLEIQLLRGAAPDFLRNVRIHLRYVPHVPEEPKEDPGKSPRGQSQVVIFDAVRLPLAKDLSLPTFPPLVVADPARGGQMTIEASTRADDLGSINFNLDGPFRGTTYTSFFSGPDDFTRMRFQPSGPGPGKESILVNSYDGLLHGQLDVRRGRENKTGPILFVPMSENGIAHYKFDFDRDGSDEWVLESPSLRVILSPEDGGRVIALVDKDTNESLITMDGALQDFIVSTPQAGRDAEAQALAYPYETAWVNEADTTALLARFKDSDLASSGPTVEKAVRFVSPEAIEVAYRVSKGQGSGQTSLSANGQPTYFESVTGVPIFASAEEHTEFCWQDFRATTNDKPHCEDFTPNGAEIHIPQEVTRIEVRAKNHPSLAVEWAEGKATIVPKAFSAQIKLVFPAALEADHPLENTLRFAVVPGS